MRDQIIFGNPADTVEGPIREEREPAILRNRRLMLAITHISDQPQGPL
jgi:hypothetical protein